MTGRRRWTLVRWLATAAGVLLVAGFTLTVAHPRVDGRADSYACAAPFDTVLDDAPNFPQVGPPPADADAIAERCRAVGRTRYRQGLSLLAAAGCCGIAAIIVRRRRRGLSA